MSGSPPRRLAPNGAFTASAIGPGTRMMQYLANWASRGAHSPKPASRRASSSSDLDHIVVPVVERPELPTADGPFWTPCAEPFSSNRNAAHRARDPSQSCLADMKELPQKEGRCAIGLTSAPTPRDSRCKWNRVAFLWVLDGNQLILLSVFESAAASRSTPLLGPASAPQLLRFRVRCRRDALTVSLSAHDPKAGLKVRIEKHPPCHSRLAWCEARKCSIPKC
jgi:hypothetical protein